MDHGCEGKMTGLNFGISVANNYQIWVKKPQHVHNDYSQYMQIQVQGILVYLILKRFILLLGRHIDK